MAFSSYTITAVLTAALLVVAISSRAAEGQTDCASKLVPCAEYLNSTTPSAECCNSIREVVITQLPCLCKLYNTPGLLGGINMTQALMLPRYCNMSGDVSACNALAPGSSSLPPPATPGGNGSNSAGQISWMGMRALLLVSALAFLN